MLSIMRMHTSYPSSIKLWKCPRSAAIRYAAVTQQRFSHRHSVPSLATWTLSATGKNIPPQKNSTSKKFSGESTPPSSPLPPVQPGDVLQLKCDKLVLGGKGVCRLPPSGFVIMCRDCLPGEELLARVTMLHKRFAEADKVASLHPPDHPATPRCTHFHECGGCTMQNLEYGAQLEAKQDQVQQLLRRVGKLDAAAGVIKPVVPCQHTYSYRNKMVFTFDRPRQNSPAGRAPPIPLETAMAGSPDAALPSPPQASMSDLPSGNPPSPPQASSSGTPSAIPPSPPQASSSGTPSATPPLVVGLLKPGSFTDVVSITSCEVQDPVANRVMQFVAAKAAELGLTVYDSQLQTGFLRQLVLRRGSRENSTDRSTTSRGCAPRTDVGTNLPEVTIDDATTTFAPNLRQQSMPVGLGKPMHTDVGTRSHEVTPDGPTATRTPTLPPHSHRVSLSEVTHTGSSAASIMVNVVASWHAPHLLRPLADALMQEVPEVVSVYSSVGVKPGSGAALERVQLIGGQATISERLCGLTFEISPESFFQVNTHQAEVLYTLVSQAAQLRPTDLLLDLYCGTGTIGLTLAASCRSLLGYDHCAPAIRDAKNNAARNGIKNAEFRVGDLDQIARELGRDGRRGRPDVVVVDPARAGLGAPVVKFLKGCGARRIVYVSCNPATLARDLAELCAATPTAKVVRQQSAAATDHMRAYRLVSVQPCDMFPHTDHIECVAVLDHNQE